MKTRRLTYSSTKISTNKALGFSLIEMLVVILILSLLSGVVITSLNSVDNRRLSNQAEKLKIWLQGVQQYATLHGLE